MKKWMMMVCVVALAAATACDNKKTGRVEDLNGEWNVTQIDGKRIAADVHPWLGFNVAERRIYGNIGANTITGMLQTGRTKGSIDFSGLGSTKMMGTPEQMKVEDDLSRALATVKTYELHRDGKLELRDAAGKKVVELERATGKHRTGQMHDNMSDGPSATAPAGSTPPAQGTANTRQPNTTGK